MLPVLNLGAFWGNHRSGYPSRFLGRNSVFLTGARAALAHAFRGSGVSERSKVLLPAYHCGSMVEPALWLNAEVVFYKLKPDLTVDVTDLENKVGSDTKALLVAHYFGFPQPLEHIKELCERYDIALIEDCAHAFFGHANGVTLGSVGDFAVASTTKFFACSEGGLIAAGSYPLKRISLEKQPLSAQLKAMLDPVEIAVDYGRLPLFGLLTRGIRAVLQSKRGRDNGEFNAREFDSRDAQAFHWLEPDLILYKGCWASRLILRASAKGRVAVNRRENYLYLLDKLSGLHRARPLFPRLAQGVVPYVFPLIVDFPEQDFKSLKDMGVPIWRWEELAESGCSVSEDYRLRLLQIPCHQDLRDSELEWITNRLTRVLGKGGKISE